MGTLLVNGSRVALSYLIHNQTTPQDLQSGLERETGFEPATNSLEGYDSTTELLPPADPKGSLSIFLKARATYAQHKLSSVEGAGFEPA